MSQNAPLEVVAGQTEWAGNNLAHNLDFIADDKLAWKPGGPALSALEVTHHAANAVRGLQAVMTGENPEKFEMPATREEAQQIIKAATAEYATWARSVSAEDAAKTISTGFMGDMPLARFAQVPAIDCLHHHGQIAYIQTLLGDTESHFMENAF